MPAALRMDDDQKIVDANETSCNLLNMEKFELIGKHITDIVEKGSLPQTLEAAT